MRLRPGFTLVELLVVVGVIALLIAVLLPVITAVQTQARTVQCMSNLRQITVALHAYAGDYRGNFPPSIGGADSKHWYDFERAGRYLAKPVNPGPTSLRGGVVACPTDEGADRSYSMNIWASSNVDPAVRRDHEGKDGKFWKPGAGNSARLILVAESFSVSGSGGTGWRSNPMIGLLGPSPGRRFGGGGGLSPMPDSLRFGPLKSELPYYRHRLRAMSGLGLTTPRGRVAIGYGDGHVALKSDEDLVRADGRSTLDSLWSAWDYSVNDPG